MSKLKISILEIIRIKNLISRGILFQLLFNLYLEYFLLKCITQNKLDFIQAYIDNILLHKYFNCLLIILKTKIDLS